jgi:prepilin-type N-terminal cleavage/methylation domain-containing protein
MRRHTHAPGFTLTELLIAVAILVGVLLAVGRIFTTTSTVTGVGKATNDVLQELAAIETQVRQDFSQLSAGGVLAIRCVAVPNDINGAALLNPSLPPDATVRADQIVIFTNNVQSPRAGTSSGTSIGEVPGQGTSSRVYYGHAFQLGEVGLAVDSAGPGGSPRSHDPIDQVFPWTNSAVSNTPVAMARTQHGYADEADTDRFSFSGAGEAVVAQVDARQWLLARQAAVLVDDDRAAANTNAKTVYLTSVDTARSVFSFVPGPADVGGGTHLELFNGRLDGAATQLHDVRRIIRTDLSDGRIREWDDGSATDQRSIISNLIYYPRAERVAPSMHRVDQALTNNVLSAACSSVRIDWTYAPRVGFRYDTPEPQFDVDRPQPWFGMPDARAYANAGVVQPDREHGVGMLGDDTYRNLVGLEDAADSFDALGVDPVNIEDIMSAGGVSDPVVYEAFFGYNRDDPFAEDYTPWPSAVRITLTLHDPDTRLEAGREVQFVLNLPSPVE